MKDSRVLTTRQETHAENDFYRTIASLGSIGDCRTFFQDLCTPAELEAMKDRWNVVRLLEEELTYRQIHERSGVSMTTIGRVARCLSSSNGYANALRLSRE